MGNVCGGNSPPSPRVSLTGAAGDKAMAAGGAHMATSGGGLTANCAAQQSSAATAIDSRKGSNGSAANHDHRNSNSSSNHSNTALRPPPTLTTTSTELSSSSSAPATKLTSEHIALRGLRLLRRPTKTRAVLALGARSNGSSSLCEAAKWACERLGIDARVAPANAGETAVSDLCCAQDDQVHLLVVDARGGAGGRTLEAEAIAKSIRRHPRGELIVIVGVVKRSFLEREEMCVAPLLAAGFNRIFHDSGSRGYWLNNLATVVSADVEAALKLQCVDSLLAALNGCKDIVQISDCDDRLLYGNRACERILGFDPSSELAGRNAWELQNTIGLAEVGETLMEEEEEDKEEDETKSFRAGKEAVKQRLEKGKVWEGSLNCKRKTGDSVPLDTVAIPVSFNGGSKNGGADHIVYVKQPPLLLREKSLTDAASAGGDVAAIGRDFLAQQRLSNSSGGSVGAGGRRSLKSFRNASCDVGSLLSGGGGGGHHHHHLPSSASSHGGMSSARRQSVAKMQHHSTVEAPITKVISIIMAAQENSPQYIAQALDKVLDILQTTDSINLFSPEVERERQKRTDAVATDLLGALLATQQQPNMLLAPPTATSLGRSSSVICRQTAGGALRNSFHRRRNSTRDSLSHRRSSTEATSSSSLLATKPSGVSIGGLSSSSSTTSHGGIASSHHHHHHHSGHRHSVPTLESSNAQVRALLERCDSWAKFDILELEKLTEKRCLVWTGMSAMVRFEVHKTLNCPESTLQNWLTLVEANYNPNPYHNSTHAADVLHAVACFLDSAKVKEYCDDLDEAACLIAAAMHDLNHPGRNSAFLCNSNAELAYLYNDITVLENHHVSLGFKLSMSDDRVNIFKNLDRDQYKLMRQSIIDMVLATEMSKHFVHVNKFQSVFSKVYDEGTGLTAGDHSGGSSRSSPGAASPDPSGAAAADPDMITLTEGPPVTPENVAILKRMMIKCADISNPARPLGICKEWAYRIAEEYFSQTDDEKKLGLPVVMPQFDRTTCSIPKSQIGFYDFFIIDMFDMFAVFTDMPELSEIINTNYLYWKEENAKEEDAKAAAEQEAEAEVTEEGSKDN